MKPAAQPNKSLMDGIATLQALAIADEPIGCRQLARMLGLEVTRVNRLLKTLAYLGIARQTASRKYVAGPGMHVLAAQSLFASGLLKRALPKLNELRHHGHVVAMGVLWKTHVTYLYHAPPEVSASEAIGRIGLYPATKGGIGMVLLAGHTDDYVASIYDEAEIPGFPKGLPSLLLTLQEIRDQGYARVLVRPEKKQYTIAVTIGDSANAALGLSGPITKSNSAALAKELTGIVHEIRKDKSKPEMGEVFKDSLFHSSPV